MIAERLAWEFESAPIREQLRLRSKGLRPHEQPKVLDFEIEILDKRPPDNQLAEEILQALRDLGTERPVGFAMGRIPISAIRAHFDRQGRSRESTDVMTRLVLDADAFFLAKHAEKED